MVTIKRNPRGVTYEPLTSVATFNMFHKDDSDCAVLVKLAVQNSNCRIVIWKLFFTRLLFNISYGRNQQKQSVVDLGLGDPRQG